MQSAIDITDLHLRIAEATKCLVATEMLLLKYMTTCYYAFISNKTLGLFTCSFLKLNNLIIFHRKIPDFMGSCQLMGQLPVATGREKTA